MRPLHLATRLAVAAAFAIAATPGLAQTGIDLTQPRNAPPRGALLRLDQVPRYQVPALAIEQLMLEDQWWMGLGMPARYAAPHEVAMTPQNAGVWESLGDQRRLWRLRVSSPGARSLNLGFLRFHLPPGAAFYLFSIGSDDELGPFTWRDVDEHGQLWTPPLVGDEMLLALAVPAAREHEVALELRFINHGYAGFGAPAPKSGGCNVDLACAAGDGWRQQGRAVGLISVAGSYYCTAFLVNNTARDRRPLLLTARHCGVHAGNAASVVVLWDHQLEGCRRDDPQADSNGRVIAQVGGLRRFQTGAHWLADDPVTDFALLELDDPIDPALGLYFAGWDRSERAPRASVVIHHPNTDAKRISIDRDPAAISSHLGSDAPGNGSHLRIGSWEVGTTEGGSSGAPLFNQDGRVVGLLHGGLAACGNHQPDWFGRLGAAWNGGGTPSTRLRDWLDPLGLGVQSLDGLSARAQRPPRAKP